MRQSDHWPQAEGPNCWDHSGQHQWALPVWFLVQQGFCRRLNCVASTRFGKFNSYSVFVSQWVEVQVQVEGGVNRTASGSGRWVRRLESSLGFRRGSHCPEDYVVEIFLFQTCDVNVELIVKRESRAISVMVKLSRTVYALSLPNRKYAGYFLAQITSTDRILTNGQTVNCSEYPT